MAAPPPPPLQGSLFGAAEPALAPSRAIQRTWLDDARSSWVDVGRGWLLGADELFARLALVTPWRQGRRRMYDRMVDDPRLSRWYRASTPVAELPDPILASVREALARHYRRPLSGPGLNYYRDGQDSVAPHSDRELRDGTDSIVAIVTLGGARPFLVRPASGGPSVDLHPGSGDLLVMGGRCQADFHHGVPKVAHADPRISVSYRWST